MKQLYTVAIFLFLFVSSFASGNQTDENLKPIAQKVLDKHFTGSLAYHSSLFTRGSNHEIESQLDSSMQKFNLLDLDVVELNNILQKNPEHLLLTIPIENGSLTLDLVPSSIYTPDFSLVDARTQQELSYEKGLHFWGIIKGDNNSIAAISIFKDEVMGIISSAHGNLVLGKLEQTVSPMHIIYNDKDLKNAPPVVCYTEEGTKTYASTDLQMPSAVAQNCIRIYWEVEYKIYQDKGTVQNTINYVSGLFNQSAIIYANDNIPVTLSQIYVWTTPSPYTANTTISLLGQFQNTRTSFNGDLGHLLGTIGNGGVAAGLTGLCNPNVRLRQCYSDINMFYSIFPVYSWSVTVVTHEQGHLLGSRHTHACVWNGNSTAIDGCAPSVGYPYEGPCSGASIPPTGGTIMSYCHMTSVGINFSNGFGLQPSAVIANNFNNASCLTLCSSSFCNSPTALVCTGVSTTTATLSWDTASGAIRYIVRYRILGTSSWITDSTIVPPYNASNLLPATNYEWEVQTVCSGESSFFSSPELFTTVPLSCDPPTNLNATTITNFSARLQWNAVPGALAYVVQYRATGASLWITDTVTTIFYNAGILTDTTEYEFHVMTLCVGGSNSTYTTIHTFTTSSRNYILLKPGSRCGKDAMIWNAPPHNRSLENFGDSPFMLAHAYTNSGIPDTSRSLFQFDLSSIPVGSVIVAAYLSLYNDSTANSLNGEHNTFSRTNESFISRIVEPWNEHTVTWVNQPATTNLNQVTHATSTTPHEHFLNMDVTQLVIDMVNDPENSFGFQLRLQNEQPYCGLVFATSDHLNFQLFPRLEIYINSPNDSSFCYRIRNDAGCGGDAFIWNTEISANGSTNYDGNSSLLAHAWTNSGVPDTSRALLGFDLSMLPPGTNISSAELSLYNDSLSNSFNGQHMSLSGSNEAWIAGITSPWDPSLITWNHGVKYSLNNATSIPGTIAPNQHFPNMDVRPLTQDMINNPGIYYGYMVRLKTETNYRALVLASSDNPDGSKHPVLEVCVDNTTGVKKIPKDAFLIYPNPASDYINIRSNTNEEILIRITDAIGKLVYIKTSKFLSGHLLIPVSSLSNGIYFLEINRNENFFNTQIIIVR